MNTPRNSHGLPPLMTVKAGRYYYLQPKEGGGRKWVSLSRNLDEALQQHAALTNGRFDANALEPTAPLQRLVVALRRTFDAAKKRSKGRDAIYFTLTFDDVMEMATRQNWRCAMTGIKFADTKVAGAHARPFMASIDRVKCSEGYTKTNSRLVCVAVNLALSTYGESVFGTIARAYAARTSVTKVPLGKKTAKLAS